MILVDSSVWIGVLRGQDTAAVGRLRRLVEVDSDQVLVGDLILVEVLQGARDEAHAGAIERRLTRFPVAPLLGPGLAVEAARNYRTLRGMGVTIRKTIDVVIGSFCIARGHALLHDDRDFEAMTRLGLRVA